MKRARKETKRLKGYLGRVIRDIERKVQNPDEKLSQLYALHAPEVEWISKGKAYKKYEFGCKVAIATTSKTNQIFVDNLVGIEYLISSIY